MAKKRVAFISRLICMVLIVNTLFSGLFGVEQFASAMENQVALSPGLESSQIMYLPFEGDLQDQSSQGINGTPNGTITYNDGIIGEKALDTTSGYVGLGSNSKLKFGSSQNFTFSFWMKAGPQNASEVSGEQTDTSLISNKDWNSGANTGWMLGIIGDKLQWNFKTASATRLDLKNTNSSIVVANNVWHHVVVSHDRQGAAKFYIDNQLKASVSLAGSAGSIDSTFPVNIAADGKNKYRYKGLLEDFRIFDKALDESEVQELNQLYIPVKGIDLDRKSITLSSGSTESLTASLLPENVSITDVTWQADDSSIVEVTPVSGTLQALLTAKNAGTTTVSVKSKDGGFSKIATVKVTPSDLGLYLPFDNNLEDISGQYNSLVKENGTLGYGESVFGDGALNLSAGYATLDAEKLKFGDSQNFSIAFWMKSNVNLTGNVEAIITNQDASSPDNSGWLLGVKDNKLQWNLKKTIDLNDTNSNVLVGDNKWHLVVAAYDRSDKASIYVDGTLQAAIPISEAGDIDTALDLNIGADGQGANRYSGLLDELQIYNRALTQQQVSTMFDKYLPVTDVAMSTPSLSQIVGDVAAVSATIQPAAATNQRLIWSSSNPAVAQVTTITGTAKAQVEALSSGTAQISVRTQNNGLTASFNVTVKPDGLGDHGLLHLRFDGDLKDSSSLNNTTSAIGSVKYNEGHIGTNAVDLSAGYINVAPNNLQFESSRNFTVSFWMKAGSNGDTSIISNKDWDSGSNNGWVLGVNNDKLQWNFKGKSLSRLDLKNTNNTIVVGDNKWHHVVVAHDRSDKATFYVDKVLKASISIAGVGDIDTTFPLAIGADGKGNYRYEGLLDELQVFDYAMPANDVAILYNQHVVPTGVSIRSNPITPRENPIPF